MSIRDFHWKTQRALGKISISKAPKINQKSGINSTEIFTSEKPKAKTPLDNRGHFSKLLMQKQKQQIIQIVIRNSIRPQPRDRTATAHNVSRTGAVWDWWPKSFSQRQRYKKPKWSAFPNAQIALVRCYAPLPVSKRFIRTEISSGRFGFPSKCQLVTSIEKHKEL